MLALDARRMKWLKKELAKAEKLAAKRRAALLGVEDDILTIQAEIEEIEKKG